MVYDDIIYGVVEFNEPVLEALINSQALARLKGIYQGGITGLLGIAADFTRFDHSVGVCLLLRRLGAPLVEQIAGLLHDVSHTAFSHVVDFVYDDVEQTYHETLFEETLAESDVPGILANYGYDWRDLLDETRYPLLEQPLPHLCADRLDYFFRDSVPLETASLAEIRWLLGFLRVRDERIVVSLPSMPGLPARSVISATAAAASWLGLTFMATDDRCWSDLREVALYQLTAEAIRAALKTGCIAPSDLRGADWPLWEKLRACEDPEVQRLIGLVNPDTRFILDESAPDLWATPKIRAVDPDVWLEGRLQPLSHIDPTFAVVRPAYLMRKERRWGIRIVRDEA